MTHLAKSIRAFIGAKDYGISRSFYQALGFEENVISENMSYFSVNDALGFYLQNYYVKDWIENSMLFLEVNDVQKYWEMLNDLSLPEKFSSARLTPIKQYEWGKECFLHDPSGILWHFGQFI